MLSFFSLIDGAAAKEKAVRNVDDSSLSANHTMSAIRTFARGIAEATTKHESTLIQTIYVAHYVFDLVMYYQRHLIQTSPDV